MSNRSYYDRILGCWLGKSIGGTLGLPVEGTMERLDLKFYDPVPIQAPPNDDLELQLVWLDLVRKRQPVLSPVDFAQSWLDHIHYMWDEYGRCRWNLRRGVPIESVGIFENPFQSCMGSAIRSEIWACLFPGDPDSAAHYAAMDASMDHGLEGIAGEVLFAAMQSVVLTGGDISEAIEIGRARIPDDCETARAVDLIRNDLFNDVPAWESRENLVTQYGNMNFTHSPFNVAITLWSLWHGHGDFEKTILLAVNAGFDKDCTAASAGATVGLQLGASRLPSRWVEPIGAGVHVGAGIQGISVPETLEELTRQTLSLMGKLHPHSWTPRACFPDPKEVDLHMLPSSVEIFTESGSSIWANGEMPDAVKSEGGAEWTWTVNHDNPMQIISLAENGGRLFFNGKMLHENPGNPLYIPAPHRVNSGICRSIIRPGRGAHSIHFELNRSCRDQKAAVLLAYPNHHLAPWSIEELPYRARL